MSKFYEHNQRFELKKMIRWEVGILKVKTGILRSTLASRRSTVAAEAAHLGRSVWGEAGSLG